MLRCVPSSFQICIPRPQKIVTSASSFKKSRLERVWVPASPDRNLAPHQPLFIACVQYGFPEHEGSGRCVEHHLGLGPKFREGTKAPHEEAPPDAVHTRQGLMVSSTCAGQT